ncbi:multiple epidermal growth factor-like domains protein 11 isoform X1 [Limulus polyphemus]|uniref:Multiple epidermal growth factor-like domains protein 11 isoform X1 n=1 Tax=Limulus polyphemus TaxID=6850 RepID=A0ABM1SVN6_LIMPO|nr:multiple epidermal growth factor-like domains protein 11 isoform X1 [Limulus polyphemus]
MLPNYVATLLAGWLLWSTQHGCDARPILMSPSISPARATLNADISCDTAKDCGDIRVVFCDNKTGKCGCQDFNSILSGEGHCLKGKQLGQTCTTVEQCQFHNGHAHCVNGVCVCQEGFFHVQDINGTTCLEGSFMDTEDKMGVTEEPGSKVQTKMIPIVVALGIMFVGICVAMHLFSKARFRNQRTIFNSPHPRLMHIRVSRNQKSGKRRTSLQVTDCRQLSSMSSQPSLHSSRSETQQESQDPLNYSNKSTGSSVVGTPTSLPLSSFDDANAVKKGSVRRTKADVEPLTLSYTVVPSGPSSPTIIISNKKSTTFTA